jgi:pyruvate kinase
VADLYDTLADLRSSVEREGRARLASWSPLLHRRSFRLSALNLACYLSLREHDLRAIQLALMPLGLSSLGRCESRVLESLDAVLATLGSMAHDAEASAHPSPTAFFRGTRLLERHTEEVLGSAPGGRNVRIMVTLGAEATDYERVRRLVAAGMDIGRVNLGHDSPDEWFRIAGNVRRAASEVGRPCRVAMDLCGPRARTTDVVGGVERIEPGARILLTSSPGAAASEAIVVSCSLPEVVGALEPGQRLWFDEGSIGADVEEVHGGGALLRVVHTSPKGGKLRPGKGINVPDTQLPLDSLTPKDLADLDHVCAAADAVGYSFVRTPEDVARLQAELAARGRASLPVLLKVETRAAIENLPELIVRTAGAQPMAIMIARGDLAVEIGHVRLAEMQEELLWLCEAAQVPVIWATQVLDTFVRKGVHSRGELTDAAMAERAECVLLNKGPFLPEAVETLATVLTRMEGHQAKKTSRMRALGAWSRAEP